MEVVAGEEAKPGRDRDERDRQPQKPAAATRALAKKPASGDDGSRLKAKPVGGAEEAFAEWLEHERVP